MRSVLVAVAAALALTAPLPSVASGYETYGPGVKSCGHWTNESHGELRYDLSEWVLGYVSAAGYYNDYHLRDTDADGISAYMDTYCKAHPLDSVEKGAQHLIEDLRIEKQSQ